jgi:hypothetical protein
MLESKGTKRTLSALFAVLACAADFIPAVAPFKSVLLEVAGLLGVVGISHAAASSFKK